jgi:hypothetical protein
MNRFVGGVAVLKKSHPTYNCAYSQVPYADSGGTHSGFDECAAVVVVNTHAAVVAHSSDPLGPSSLQPVLWLKDRIWLIKFHATPSRGFALGYTLSYTEAQTTTSVQFFSTC